VPAYFAICPCRSNHYCVGRGRVSHPFLVSQDPVRTGGFVTLLRQPARYAASSNRRMGAKRSKQSRMLKPCSHLRVAVVGSTSCEAGRHSPIRKTVRWLRENHQQLNKRKYASTLPFA